MEASDSVLEDVVTEEVANGVLFAEAANQAADDSNGKNYRPSVPDADARVAKEEYGFEDGRCREDEVSHWPFTLSMSFRAGEVCVYVR